MNASARTLRDVAVLFLKLGTIGFGGPAAHIAMMEDEIVKKRQWITPGHFLDLIGATNLIPGPNSTEMTMHCGYERAGWKGLIVAGLSFILPAVLITSALAWMYEHYGQLPQVEPFIYGINPAVIAIIVSALLSLAQKAMKTVEITLLGIATLVLALLGVNEIITLFACGFTGLLLYEIKQARHPTNGFFPIVLLQAGISGLKAGNLGIFLIFLKVGSLLYGSGYVLFAFLDAELVARGLLSRQVLIDAIAVGQFTPGPVLSAATFIGWQMNGWQGALAATTGIFLPSFLFVALLNPLIPRLRQSKLLSAFLDAVNVAAVAVIAAVCIEMSKDTLSDWRTIVIAILSLSIALGLKKLNSAFIVLGGAALGYVLFLF